MSRGAVLRAALVSASATFACVKIPDFVPRDAPVDDRQADVASDSMMPTPGATATTSADQIIVTFPGLYEMRFSSQAYHFPYNWGIGSGSSLTQVLYTPDPQNCTLEKDMGTAFYPAHIFSSTLPTGLSPTTEVDTIEVVGPPIAKVRLRWAYAVGAPCSATPQGDSTFTFLPDGRVVRMDVAHMPTSAAGSNCDCAGDNDWYVTTYATFTSNVLQGLQGISTLPTPTTSVSLNQASAYERIPCLQGNSDSFSLAIGWRNTQGARLRSVDATGIALVGDMIMPVQTIGGGANNGLVGDTTTTYWPALGAECDALRSRIDSLASNPPELLIGGSPIGLAQDGIYGGETAFGTPGLGVGSSAVMVAPQTISVGAFALWLDFGSHARGTPPVVTKQSGTPSTPWFTLQRMGSQYLFWFPEGLSSGDQIEIRTE